MILAFHCTLESENPGASRIFSVQILSTNSRIQNPVINKLMVIARNTGTKQYTVVLKNMSQIIFLQTKCRQNGTLFLRVAAEAGKVDHNAAYRGKTNPI
jgi:hypothetical protein